MLAWLLSQYLMKYRYRYTLWIYTGVSYQQSMLVNKNLGGGGEARGESWLFVFILLLKAHDRMTYWAGRTAGTFPAHASPWRLKNVTKTLLQWKGWLWVYCNIQAIFKERSFSVGCDRSSSLESAVAHPAGAKTVRAHMYIYCLFTSSKYVQ